MYLMEAEYVIIYNIDSRCEDIDSKLALIYDLIHYLFNVILRR